MAFRRLLRGRVDWEHLEGVGAELARRYDREAVRVEFLDADNWLSTPCVVDEQWFVKVLTPQNALVHALFTTGRNIGAFSTGTEGFFETFSDPVEMAEHELVATERMADIGVNAPDPVEAFEYENLGVLVLEYLADFRTVDELPAAAVEAVAPAVFGALAALHDHGLAHGDLRAENVLVVDGEPYFIDATKVREGAADDARAYDLACALAVFAPVVGAREAVAAAAEHYSPAELLSAREFLDFVNVRPDHGFDAASVKGEIEKRAA
ncbi:MAG: RIO1 family regulatory kinase/ATPase [Halobacteriaceae archaeon]